ncbi:MAG: hypothetical protein HIU91_15610 [Acidobacteria bacterium]|nr:hypothetical protein [Acidobacteriota bacterium]
MVGIFAVEAVSVVQGLVNPAADRRRMLVALGVLIGLGALSWFTIDSSAVIHMHGYASGNFGIADRDVELRWIPMLILGLFALRVVLAHTRARVERRDSAEVVEG